jgi:hypothetical protein
VEWVEWEAWEVAVVDGAVDGSLQKLAVVRPLSVFPDTH